MKPTQGRIVLFRQPTTEAPCNGSRIHPAIVNCSFGDGDTPALNLTVFPDCAPPQSRTSVLHASHAHSDEAARDWPPRGE